MKYAAFAAITLLAVAVPVSAGPHSLPADTTGEREPMDCKLLEDAEKDVGHHLRLFLKSVRDANRDLLSVKCISASSQVARRACTLLWPSPQCCA